MTALDTTDRFRFRVFLFSEPKRPSFMAEGARLSFRFRGVGGIFHEPAERDEECEDGFVYFADQWKCDPEALPTATIGWLGEGVFIPIAN